VSSMKVGGVLHLAQCLPLCCMSCTVCCVCPLISHLCSSSPVPQVSLLLDTHTHQPPCRSLPTGIRRVEVPGALPELSYPRDRSQRFTDELISQDLKIFKYR
jgi:hypothetical protein